MQRKRRVGAVVFLVLALSGCTGGCGKPAATTRPALPFEGVVLKVAAPAGPAEELLRQRAPAWASRQGCTVEVLSYKPGGSLPEADVWVLRAAQMPRWAAAGELAPVPSAMTDRDDRSYDWNKLHNLYRDKLLLWERTAYGVPLLGESPLCFYRTDLLSDPGHRQDYHNQHQRQLEPPETWQDFLRIAEFFKGRAAAGLDDSSLPPLPTSDEALDRLFYQTAAPFVRRAIYEAPAVKPSDADLFSFHYDLTSGKPRLEEPGFVEALRVLQRLQACRRAGTADEPEQAFAARKAVLCIADAPWVPRFRKGAVKDHFGVCRVPGSEVVYTADGEKPIKGGNHVPYLGAAGWVAVVPARAAHAEGAWALLAELSGPSGSRQVVISPQWGGGAFRTEHGLGASDWNGFGFDSEQAKAFAKALGQTLWPPGLRNPLVRLRTPDERSHREALTAELRKALADGSNPGTALATAATRWQELDRVRGTAALADYHRSLGLDPPR